MSKKTKRTSKPSKHLLSVIIPSIAVGLAVTLATSLYARTGTSSNLIYNLCAATNSFSSGQGECRESTVKYRGLPFTYSQRGEQPKTATFFQLSNFVADIAVWSIVVSGFVLVKRRRA